MSWLRQEAADVAISAAATETTLAEITVDEGTETLGILVTNTGANDFDAFSVWVSVDGTTYVEADAATPASPVEWVITALATLASEASGSFQVDVRGIRKVKLEASADTTATTASAWAHGH